MKNRNRNVTIVVNAKLSYNGEVSKKKITEIFIRLQDKQIFPSFIISIQIMMLHYTNFRQRNDYELEHQLANRQMYNLVDSYFIMKTVCIQMWIISVLQIDILKWSSIIKFMGFFLLHFYSYNFKGNAYIICSNIVLYSKRTIGLPIVFLIGNFIFFICDSLLVHFSFLHWKKLFTHIKCGRLKIVFVYAFTKKESVAEILSIQTLMDEIQNPKKNSSIFPRNKKHDAYIKGFQILSQNKYLLDFDF